MSEDGEGSIYCFQSPFSGAFESYLVGCHLMRQLRSWLSISIFRSLWILRWPSHLQPLHHHPTFNLHFQEPLNLTSSFGKVVSRPACFQSPFSGAFESYEKGLDNWSAQGFTFNLHFQEPLNLTMMENYSFGKSYRLSISIFRSLWILRWVGVMNYGMGKGLSISIFRSLWILLSETASLPSAVYPAFNLHFQEPLNLTRK